MIGDATYVFSSLLTGNLTQIFNLMQAICSALALLPSTRILSEAFPHKPNVQ